MEGELWPNRLGGAYLLRSLASKVYAVITLWSASPCRGFVACVNATSPTQRAGCGYRARRSASRRAILQRQRLTASCAIRWPTVGGVDNLKLRTLWRSFGSAVEWQTYLEARPFPVAHRAVPLKTAKGFLYGGRVYYISPPGLPGHSCLYARWHCAQHACTWTRYAAFGVDSAHVHR